VAGVVAATARELIQEPCQYALAIAAHWSQLLKDVLEPVRTKDGRVTIKSVDEVLTFDKGAWLTRRGS
jgi:hypothetical protein